MQFHSITGQKDTKEQLVQMIQHNRLSHALLFLGKEGSGALQLAMAFAQYIVCEKVNGKQLKVESEKLKAEPSLFGEPEPVAEAQLPTLNSQLSTFNDSCGECAACKKATALIHPDIHFSYPVITKKAGEKPISADFIKEWREFVVQSPYGNVYDWLQFIGAENKQGNITATECNDINRTMSLKSFESEYKILIMWKPEFLGKEGNKLLKLIEEPPPNTLFLFVAESEEQILPTILSRTQLVKIPLLTNLEVEAALELKEGVSIEKAGQIAALAEGNYREALQLLQHAEDDWQAMLRDWLNAVLKTGPVAQVKWIDETAKLGREKQKQFLKYFIHLLEQAVRLRALGDSNNIQQTADHDFALRLNKICGIGQQEAIINELDKASYYIERNANAKMLFHALSIRLYHIISNKSVILVN
ncbi:ATP-binding protein [Ferruginibacter sp. SUN106]|uniref:DNA polymerase III subunit n=1 Tax=Ferruginibacter sp. SUN106 TaxID=2978348 RepID=UPI003D3633D4